MKLTTETTFVFDTHATRAGRVKAGQLKDFLAHLPPEAELEFIDDQVTLRVRATYDTPNTHHTTGPTITIKGTPLHKNSSGGPCRCRFGPEGHGTVRGVLDDITQEQGVSLNSAAQQRDG